MGNFSKNTFDQLKHYVGVRLQQGVPLVDADWNEMEDIRKHELRTFLKWFVGNGVPKGNDGFRIVPLDGSANDFTIKGGSNGEPGYCLVEGWDAMIEQDIDYTHQPLYNNDTLAVEWGVEPLKPLSPPSSEVRTDTVYLDVWEREVDAQEDGDLVNDDIGIETCVRLKREWVVRVAEGLKESTRLQEYLQEHKIFLPGHMYYPLASLKRTDSQNAIVQNDITDLRRTGLAVLSEEITIKDGNVGIGTSAPGKKLEVAGDIKTSGSLIVGNEGQFGLKTTNENAHIIPDDYFGNMHLLSTKGMVVIDSNHHKFRSAAGVDWLTFLNGNVGIGTSNPSFGDSRVLEINGEPRPVIRLVRPGGSEYIIGTEDIDDKLRIVNSEGVSHPRDSNKGITIDTQGNVGIGTPEPKEKLDVDGNISGKSYRNVCQSFFVGGDGDKFYAVVFRDGDWDQGPAEFEITRSNVHLDREVWGSMNLTINWHCSHAGNGANFLGHRYYHSYRTFVKDMIDYQYLPYLLIWLRGNTTYNYRSLNNRVVLDWILGTGNQTCDFGPIAVDATYRTEQAAGIKPGTTIAGDFYASGNIYANNKLVPVGSSDYAEYFESKDGKKIEVGTSVILEGEKIRPVKKNEVPIGIISASPGIVGGVHIEWPKKHLRDEFGRVIMEEYKEEIMKSKKEKIKKERQKMEKKTVEEEVKRTEIIKIKGKYCQKQITETIEREIEEPLFEEVDLYDVAGKNKIGKHKIPVMETYEEEIDVLDEKGQPMMVCTGKFETKTRPKINPEYDETKEYIPREKRPEWNCVGLLGQLPLRKGQPTAPTWIKIKDISKDVELWLVK